MLSQRCQNCLGAWLKLVNLCGACTDGAPAILGAKGDFQKLIQDRAPQPVPPHCIIHQQAPASKTLPNPLRDGLKQIIKMVNYVKSGALNSRFFKQICKEID